METTLSAAHRDLLKRNALVKIRTDLQYHFKKLQAEDEGNSLFAGNKDMKVIADAAKTAK